MTHVALIVVPMNTTDHPGLSPAEAARRLQQAGPNRLFTPAPVRFWAIAWEEIREPMILLLLIVGVLYSLWGSLGDAITILVVIVCLVAAEVVNEFRAKRAITALKRLSAPRAKVRRGGEVLAKLNNADPTPECKILSAPKVARANKRV